MGRDLWGRDLWGRDLWGGIYGVPHSHPVRTPLLWGWECNMEWIYGAGSMGRDLWGAPQPPRQDPTAVGLGV